MIVGKDMPQKNLYDVSWFIVSYTTPLNICRRQHLRTHKYKNNIPLDT